MIFANKSKCDIQQRIIVSCENKKRIGQLTRLETMFFNTK